MSTEQQLPCSHHSVFFLNSQTGSVHIYGKYCLDFNQIVTISLKCLTAICTLLWRLKPASSFFVGIVLVVVTAKWPYRSSWLWVNTDLMTGCFTVCFRQLPQPQDLWWPVTKTADSIEVKVQCMFWNLTTGAVSRIDELPLSLVCGPLGSIELCCCKCKRVLVCTEHRTHPIFPYIHFSDMIFRYYYWFLICQPVLTDLHASNRGWQIND